MKKNSRFELRINSEQLQELRAFADTNDISLTDLITLASLEYVRTKSGRVQDIAENVRTEKPIVRTKEKEENSNVRTEQKPVEKPNNAPSWLKGVEESRKRLEERKRAVK